jgi:hypothetical protein
MPFEIMPGLLDLCDVIRAIDAVRAGLAGRRNREGAPCQRPGVDVAGADPAPGAERAAGAFALHHEVAARRLS